MKIYQIQIEHTPNLKYLTPPHLHRLILPVYQIMDLPVDLEAHA